MALNNCKLQYCFYILGQLLYLSLCILYAAALNTHVEFDLGLGSGRTCTAPCIVGKFEVQNVGLGKSGGGLLAGLHVNDHIVLVITELLHLQVTECLRRILTKLFHDLCDLSCTVDTLHGDSILSLLEVTVLFIHGYHHIPQSHIMLLAVCSHFAQTHNSYNSVLISCMGTCQTAVALFQTKYIIVAASLLEELDLLTDELEPCQYFDQLYAVSLGNGLCHIGGNNGGYQCRILGHSAGCSLLS